MRNRYNYNCCWTEVVVCIFSILFSLKANANVTRVPENFATIQDALNSIAGGDTIVISASNYRERVQVSCNVTIASNYIFTGDSNQILNTIWISDSAGNLINPQSYGISLIGIKFVAISVSREIRMVLSGVLSHFELSNCRFEGVFDSASSTSRRILFIDGSPDIIINNCLFSADSNAKITWIRIQNANNVKVFNTTVLGRNRNSNYIFSVNCDSIDINQCNFLSVGKGLF